MPGLVMAGLVMAGWLRLRGSLGGRLVLRRAGAPALGGTGIFGLERAGVFGLSQGRVAAHERPGVFRLSRVHGLPPYADLAQRASGRSRPREAMSRACSSDAQSFHY